MMKYTTFLREHLTWLIVFAGLLFSLEVLLLTLDGASFLMIYTAGALTVSYFVCTYVEYWSQKRYFTQILQMEEELNKKYLLPEMLSPGKKQEERNVHAILCDMERSMSEQVSEKQRTSREYKEYIEMWVHEIKIPIATAKMILENHKEMDYGFGAQIDRLEKYVEQALFYARSSDVEKDYFINKIELKKVVEQALLQRKTELMSKHTSIQIENCDIEVYSDSKWLEFLIGQVLDNSIKYSKEEGLTLTIYANDGKEQTLLCIKDNGIGVNAEEVERVFDKGFTGSNGRKYKKSTGIGLYLCKKLCRRLGHHMLFTSKEGTGSMVTFVFPKSGFLDEVR